MKQRRIGTLQYPETLPLKDREIVLTFDDGPIPPHSERVLDALAAECVKATFFILGEQATESPDIVRRARKENLIVKREPFQNTRGLTERGA